MGIFDFDVDGDGEFSALDMEIVGELDDASGDNALLIERAYELGLDPEEYDSAEELQEAVDEAEEAQ
ncbi:MAG TPA: hypothetical protein PLM92_00470 [Bacillota bacterium]|nr:hypothetical protein [Bacillota bacterium]HUM56026.1 hypothetical protein [Bacillota bacterium]